MLHQKSGRYILKRYVWDLFKTWKNIKESRVLKILKSLEPSTTYSCRGLFFISLFFTNNTTSEQAPSGGGGGWARRSQALVFLGWVGPKVTSYVRQIDARQFAPWPQHIAVRGYVALTRGARTGARGYLFIKIFCISSQLSTASGTALSIPLIKSWIDLDP